jgi:glycosyltransferase involved in cell wall biosynthesis
MRIVHFLMGRCNPDSANGVDKTVYYLSRAQSKLDHKVFVFCMTPKDPLPIRSVNIRTFPTFKNPFRLPKRLLNAMDEVSPDVVHLHSVFIPQNVFLAKWLYSKKIPYVITPHGGLIPQALRRRKWHKAAFKTFLECSYWNNVDFIHAVGELEATCLKNTGVKCPIIIAPNAIDINDVPDPDSLNRNYLREICPHIEGKRIFLFIGRLDIEHKGLDLLIMAFARVRHKLKNVMLILVGPEWYGAQTALEQLVREAGISDHVLFTGPKYGTEKFDTIISADVFIHTSRYEAGSFSVLEALAMGKPCLITESVGFKEFFQKYEAGFRVKLTLDDIAEGLIYFSLISTYELKEMSRGIRRAVFKEFSWEKTARILCKAY